MARKKKEEMGILEEVTRLGCLDAEALSAAEQSYGDSWKRRGGTGAFMMLARKWDRIENQASKFNYDIFAAIESDRSLDGIIDDIGDLRRYLFLVEVEMRTKLGPFAFVAPQDVTEVKRGNSEVTPLGTAVEGNTVSLTEEA
tara:strand:+ start:444 stop:869 length:426 start_codon:yes stop_codon:yes gene_type:complete